MSSFSRDSIFMHGCAHHYFCAWQCQCQERSQLDFIYTRIDLNLLLFFSYPIPFTSSHSVLAAHSYQISSYKNMNCNNTFDTHSACHHFTMEGAMVKTPYLWMKIVQILNDCKSIKNNQYLLTWQCQCQDRSQLDFIYTRIDLNLLHFFWSNLISSHSVLAGGLIDVKIPFIKILNCMHSACRFALLQ